MNLTEIEAELSLIHKEAPILEARTDPEARWLLCMITKRYYGLQKIRYEILGKIQKETFL